MLRFRLIFPLLVIMLLSSSCNRHGFFYYPNRALYTDPEKLGMPYELLRFPSQNGKLLYALLFRTTEEPKGIVVHFHGNFGNVSNHFLESQFLVKYGYDVLIFDYEGYGGSEGKPTPKRTVADGTAAIQLAREKNRNPSGSVLVFGQSLGAAVACVVAAQNPEVRGVVLEAGFSSYRTIARAAIKRAFVLWPLYPFYPLILTRSLDPVDYIGRISPRPVLIIHGTADRVIPPAMSKTLYDKAKEPKTLWMIDGADHLRCRTVAGVKYEKKLAAFFDNALGANQK